MTTTPPSDIAGAIERLEPCPLCGGKAEIWRAHPDEPPRRRAWIAGMDRCLVLTKEYDTDAEAIAAWNTRPQPSGEGLTDAMLAEAFAKTSEYECPDDELDYATAPDEVKEHFRRAAEYLNSRQALAAHQPPSREGGGE